MYNIQEFWRQVRRVEAELPNTAQGVLITSIESRDRGMRGGVVCAADREVAAKRIVDGTHRLATDDEVRAHIADEQARSNQAQVDALTRAGRTIVSLPPRPGSDKKNLSNATAEPGRKDGK